MSASPAERPRQTSCKNGHPYPESKRPGRRDCALCHRESQKARYHADPERHRKAASEYQKEHREERNAYMRAYYQTNLESRRAYGRWQAQLRLVGRHNTEAIEYTEILRDDPCCYCGESMEHIDHITPVSRGGSNDWFNLTAACRPCNSSKKDRSLLAFLLAGR